MCACAVNGKIGTLISIACEFAEKLYSHDISLSAIHNPFTWSNRANVSMMPMRNVDRITSNLFQFYRKILISFNVSFQDFRNWKHHLDRQRVHVYPVSVSINLVHIWIIAWNVLICHKFTKWLDIMWTYPWVDFPFFLTRRTCKILHTWKNPIENIKHQQSN